MRALVILLSLFGSWAHAQVTQPFFFMQASDTQLGHYTKNADFVQETANFEFLITTANRLRPAFLVMTGDLVNRAGHPEQIAEYKRIAAKLDQSITLYNVPGNHDVGDVPTPGHLARYRERFGSDYYTFRHGGAAFFVLNSCIISNPQRVPGELEKQEAWLRTELEKAKRDGARPLMVFQHHPWFVKRADEEDQYINIAAETRKRYLALFREHGVTHVFAGHLHRNVEARSEHLEMITTGAIGMPRGGDRSGFRVVIVRPEGVEHRYHDLGLIPNQVELQPVPATTGAR